MKTGLRIVDNFTAFAWLATGLLEINQYTEPNLLARLWLTFVAAGCFSAAHYLYEPKGQDETN